MDQDFRSLEDRLRSLRPAGPSDLLREQVTKAARSAWYEPSIEVKWWIPIKRLGIAAAAAVVLIWSADYAGDRTTVGWQTARTVEVDEPASSSDEEWNDTTNHVLVRYTMSGPRRIDMAAIREYHQQVRQMLDEQG